MPLTLQDAMAQIERGEAVRKASHEAEALRQQFSGYGCDMGPFVSKTDLQKHAEAEARVAAHNSAEAALKRELIAAAEANVPGAYSVLCAADRGDEGWQDRARNVVTAMARVAA